VVYLRRSVFTARYGLTLEFQLAISGRAMDQAVSCWPVTAEVRVQSLLIQCEICGGESGIVTGFSPSTSVFRSLIPPMLHTHLHLHVMLSRRTNGRSLGTF